MTEGTTIDRLFGVDTHVTTLIARTHKLIYPDIFIQARYRLNPKTNLFIKGGGMLRHELRLRLNAC